MTFVLVERPVPRRFRVPNAPTIHRFSRRPNIVILSERELRERESKDPYRLADFDG